MSDQNAMPVALIEWKPMPRNSLRGFATVRIGRAMKIKDVTVHSANGKRWASLPSKPIVKSDGTVMKDDNGKIKYVPIVEWLDRESANRFSEGVIQAVEREYPGATGE